MSYLSVGTVLVQSDVLNSALSPVVYGDIALSIKINTQNTHTNTHKCNSCQVTSDFTHDGS